MALGSVSIMTSFGRPRTATLPSIWYEADRDLQTRQVVVQALGLDHEPRGLPPQVVVRKRESPRGEVSARVRHEGSLARFAQRTLIAR
jgi:hypothetical protein